MKYMTILLTLLAGAAVASETNAPPASTFLIKAFDVEGNTVLPVEKIDGILTNYTGPAVSIGRLREGLGKLQLLYRNLGFVTISVSLPQQRLTNGVVRVRIIEGKLAHINVTGNHYFSSNNVMRALPGLWTNVLLNTRWFQPELDRANNNIDRQIYPSVSPGEEPGETDLTLKVKDRLPLHGHIEINDKATPGTPPLRIDTAVQYNNLWQTEQQFGLEYNFSPQTVKSYSTEPRFFEQPSIASYSSFYRIPFGAGENLRERSEQMPVDFGYDQVTHQFHLPPPTGEPELVVYASRSASEIPLHIGPLSTVDSTELSDITQRTGERDVTDNEDLGLKLTLPLKEFAGIRSSVTFGVDFKTYAPSTYQTNYTYVSTYGLDSFGNRVLTTNYTTALGAARHQRLDYFPLSFGWSAARPDPYGTTSFNINESVFLSGLESSRTNFQSATGTDRAGGNYGITTAGLTREQPLGRDWSLLLHADGQWASEAIINNEQYALGGTAGVRGYEEGETYGDLGWRVMTDLRAPAIAVGEFPNGSKRIPAHIRASLFMDYGESFLIERPGLASDQIEEWGTGFGAYYNAGSRFDARLTLAWALHDGAIRTAGNTTAYFSVGIQF
jgi:hemolysin activation/secretion protein